MTCDTISGVSSTACRTFTKLEFSIVTSNRLISCTIIPRGKAFWLTLDLLSAKVRIGNPVYARNPEKNARRSFSIHLQCKFCSRSRRRCLQATRNQTADRHGEPTEQEHEVSEHQRFSSNAPPKRPRSMSGLQVSFSLPFLHVGSPSSIAPMMSMQ